MFFNDNPKLFQVLNKPTPKAQFKETPVFRFKCDQIYVIGVKVRSL